MTPEPRVDVLVPTYGEPHHLEETLASVVAQTYADWRLTVFDNGPGGGAARAIVGRFLDDPRVRYDATGRVLSQRENWTRCVRAATAPYVAMLHDDDLWRTEVLERRVAFLDAHPECAFVFSSMRDVDEGGAPVRDIPFCLTEGVHAPEAFAPLLLGAMVVGSPTPLVQRWAYEDVGFDFTDRVRNIDWDMWLRMALRHPVGYLAVRDCDRRLHATSATSAAGGWGDEELALAERFSELVERDLPAVDWPASARRRRRVNGHLIAALDALEAGDRPQARRRLGAALRVTPAAVTDPRVALTVAGLLGGERARGAIARRRVERAAGRIGGW